MLAIEEHAPLAPLTTFRIGGPARYLANARSTEEILEALAFARERGLPLLVLGGGSNVLIDDEGWDGLVLRVAIGGMDVEEAAGETLLHIGAGVLWDDAVAYAVKRGLWGIENLSGIPGTCGAAPVQNIGAYGVELADPFDSLEAIDRRSGTLRHFTKAACGFGYRDSVFKREGQWIITRVTLRLRRASAPVLAYRDLKERFSNTAQPSLADIRAAVLTIRAGKFPDLTREGTAGSFFLNPVVPPEEAQRLAVLLPECPQFRSGSGVKIPLAYLLDKGLSLKGLRVGGARLFERQPIVIAATREASAADVRALAQDVIARVRAAYGISIEPEVLMVAMHDERRTMQ